MRSILLQILAVTVINLKSLPQRLWMSLATVTAIGLVVAVLLAFLAMANGFQRTIAGSGATDIAMDQFHSAIGGAHKVLGAYEPRTALVSNS